MTRFPVDEDMAPSTAEALDKAGFGCLDVRDLGLRGSPDPMIYRKAREGNCVTLCLATRQFQKERPHISSLVKTNHHTLVTPQFRRNKP